MIKVPDAQDKNKCNVKKCVIKLHRAKIQNAQKVPMEKIEIAQDQKQLDMIENSTQLCKVELRKMNLSKVKNLARETEDHFQYPPEENKKDRRNKRKLSIKTTSKVVAENKVIERSVREKKSKPLQNNTKTTERQQIANIQDAAQETKKTGDVYEFLSQSSQSEQEDPTYDVVKKLIKAGKATVARPKRGKAKQLATKKHNKAPRVKPKTVVKVQHIDLGSSEVEICNGINENMSHKISTNNANDFTTGNSENIRQEKRVEMPSPRPMVTDKLKLLQVAKNFVNQSTPINKRKVDKPEIQISPIAVSSPWRPSDEKFLPSVFYFSRNTDDLPSYSSDVITSSQRIEEKENNNLSNIENISPPGMRNKPNRNTLSFNGRKLLGNRNPLKSINILEVIDLPLRTKDKKNTTKTALENSFFRSSLKSKEPTEGVASTTQDHTNLDLNNVSVDNCFGFNDYPDDENQTKYQNTPLNRNQLKAKLKELSRFLPPKPTRANYSKIKSIFSEEPKQKNIKEMLTSTVVESKNKRLEQDQLLPFNESTNLSFGSEVQNTSELHLFDDLDEPKTNFDNSAMIKTYIRPAPRKRKKVLNVLLLSDESEDEADEDQAPERQQKRKRTKNIDKKEDVELKQFVEEFKSMCEEVEQYDLQIEKA